MKKLVRELNFDNENFFEDREAVNIDKKQSISIKINSKPDEFNYKYTNDNLYYKGEIALWKAVILQALVDLQSNSKKKIANTYRIKALMWFNLKNEEFIQVCNWAGLEPSYVYEKAKKVKENNKFFN